MCNCIKLLNDQLVEHNTQVDYSINLFDQSQPSRIYLQTHKLDSKKRIQPSRIMATFCPICGERYTPEPVAELDTSERSK